MVGNSQAIHFRYHYLFAEFVCRGEIVLHHEPVIPCGHVGELAHQRVLGGGRGDGEPVHEIGAHHIHPLRNRVRL